ncbi:fused response regulator/phosphatase [uncultured Maricaulis sp.]|uniref:PP2C family protein-serine/threonine phosphatase n=1 Tax=uncultured Maricaulis sp. TaxID=174710 RepID=UPI0030DA4510
MTDSAEQTRQPVAVDPATILVVDDVAALRLLIGGILKAAGFHTIIFAADGVEAIAIIEATPVDMIVIDIMMPRMDGFEVCRQVRGRLGLNVPILIQSGLEDADERATAFDAGASDIVSKPIHAHEIVSRVRLHLERRRMIDRLQLYQRRMEEELRAAEAMQMSLLKSPEAVAEIAEPRGASLTTFYQASNQLGGDLWQVFEIDASRFGLYMVDLSGHGVAAAINAFRLHLLAETLDQHRSAPGRWLAALNDHLYQMLPVEHFATAFYAVVDIANGRVDYAAAGSPPPIVLEADGGWRPLDGGGLLLGCVAGIQYETYQTAIAPGDRILLYSDALYENFDDADQSLEQSDLAELARSVLQSVSGAGFHQALVERVFEDEAAQRRDDLTLMLLEVPADG